MTSYPDGPATVTAISVLHLTVDDEDPQDAMAEKTAGLNRLPAWRDIPVRMTGFMLGDDYLVSARLRRRLAGKTSRLTVGSTLSGRKQDGLSKPGTATWYVKAGAFAGSAVPRFRLQRPITAFTPSR